MVAAIVKSADDPMVRGGISEYDSLHSNFIVQVVTRACRAAARITDRSPERMNWLSSETGGGLRVSRLLCIDINMSAWGARLLCYTTLSWNDRVSGMAPLKIRIAAHRCLDKIATINAPVNER